MIMKKLLYITLVAIAAMACNAAPENSEGAAEVAFADNTLVVVDGVALTDLYIFIYNQFFHPSKP